MFLLVFQVWRNQQRSIMKAILSLELLLCLEIGYQCTVRTFEYFRCSLDNYISSEIELVGNYSCLVLFILFFCRPIMQLMFLSF